MKTLDAYLSLRRVQALAVSPDGAWAAVQVARLDADGKKFIPDLWRVPLDGGPSQRLTWGDTREVAPAFRHDGALLFLSNRNPRPGKPEDGDDERLQVWAFPRHGGEPTPLTDEPLGVSSFRVAPRGDRLIVQAAVLPGVAHAEQRKAVQERQKKGPSAHRYTTMPIRYWDHWLPEEAAHLVSYDANGGDRRDLTPALRRELGPEPSFALSPDGCWLAYVSSTMGEARLLKDAIVLVETATGEARELVPSAPRTGRGNLLFSPDGARLAFTTQQSSRAAVGRQQIEIVECSSGARRPVAHHWDAWPHLHAWSDDGSTLYASAEHRGEVPLFSIDLARDEVTRLNAPGARGVFEGPALSSRGELVAIHHTHLQPPEPVALAAAPNATPRPLAALSGFTAADGAALASVEELLTPAPDGGEVHSYFLTPTGETQPGPTLLWIHGGPISSFHHGWHWRWNPLVMVARGYRVCCPNPRGSTGYGQDFIEGIWANQWGAACYRDLMAVTDQLSQRPEVDPARLAAMGGSFGGYMTNWIGGNTDRFKALVTHASVFHLSGFAVTTDFPAWWNLEQNQDGPYGPTADLYSPHTRLAHWSTPTLVIHGEKDYRVPIGEGLALFEALQSKGVPSEFLVFPDENHWIARPKNIQVWYEEILSFLGRYL